MGMEDYFLTHQPAEWRSSPSMMQTFAQLFGPQAAAMVSMYGKWEGAMDPNFRPTAEQAARFGPGGEFYNTAAEMLNVAPADRTGMNLMPGQTLPTGQDAVAYMQNYFAPGEATGGGFIGDFNQPAPSPVTNLIGTGGATTQPVRPDATALRAQYIQPTGATTANVPNPTWDYYAPDRNPNTAGGWGTGEDISLNPFGRPPTTSFGANITWGSGPDRSLTLPNTNNLGQPPGTPTARQNIIGGLIGTGGALATGALNTRGISAMPPEPPPVGPGPGTPPITPPPPVNPPPVTPPPSGSLAGRGTIGTAPPPAGTGGRDTAGNGYVLQPTFPPPGDVAPPTGKDQWSQYIMDMINSQGNTSGDAYTKGLQSLWDLQARIPLSTLTGPNYNTLSNVPGNNYTNSLFAPNSPYAGVLQQLLGGTSTGAPTFTNGNLSGTLANQSQDLLSQLISGKLAIPNTTGITDKTGQLLGQSNQFTPQITDALNALLGGQTQTANPEVANLASSLMTTGLPSGFEDMYKRRVYDPQRENMLAELSKRGVLDSSERLRQENELLNSLFGDTLLQQQTANQLSGANLALQNQGQGAQTQLSALDRAMGRESTGFNQALGGYGTVNDLLSNLIGQASGTGLAAQQQALQAQGLGVSGTQNLGNLGLNATQLNAGLQQQPVTNSLNALGAYGNLFGNVANLGQTGQNQQMNQLLQLLGIQTGAESDQQRLALQREMLDFTKSQEGRQWLVDIAKSAPGIFDLITKIGGLFGGK